MSFAAPYLNFLGHEDPPDPAIARVRILPIPYDLTTSYQPGTRRGPLAILEASEHVEWYDEELRAEPADVGIATLPPVATDVTGPAAMLDRIHRVAEEWVHPDHLLLSLGGEHSVTAPLVAAHHELYPDLTVLQVDAHGDLRDCFLSGPHSHACVMRRVVDSGIPIVQVGVRSVTREEQILMDSEESIATFWAQELADRPAAEWSARVVDALGTNVYLSIDLDGLDPSIMPATGTPEPGGLSWRQIVDLLARVLQECRCVGADVVELAPIPGLVAPDFLAARLVYRLIGLVARERGWLG